MPDVQIPEAIDKALDVKIMDAVEKRLAARVQPTEITSKKLELPKGGLLGLRMKAMYANAHPGKVDPAYREYVTKAAGALEGVFSMGGSLLAQQYSSEVIEYLRDQSVLLAAGARVETYKGTLNIGRLNGGATAEYVAEGAAPTASTLSTGAVILGAKKLMAELEVSGDMLRNPSVSSATVISADIAQAMATKADEQGIIGTGVGPSPLGLVNQVHSSNTFGITGTTTANKIADVDKAIRVVMESKLSLQGNSPGFVMCSRTFMSLKSERDAGGWVFRSMLDAGNLHGYPVHVTDSFSASNLLIFGLFTQLYFGVETDLQLDMDQPNFAADLVMFRAIQRNDWKLRHNKAFSVVTGVTY